MTTVETDTLTETIDTHLAGYCEPDRSRRIELLTAAWAPTGSLIDPPLDGVGIDGIADAAELVLTHYADHRFVRTTDVDAHHTFARYGWTLVASDGTVAVSGTDFVELADDRIVRIVGFFGELTSVGA